MRHCVDGTLTSRYAFASCEQSPLDSQQLRDAVRKDQALFYYAGTCTTPRNTQVREGEQVLAYKQLSVTQPAVCEREVRSCTK